jgi:hypothetical protein
MFLEAEPQAEPHLAEGAHHRLLLVGSLVHVCPATASTFLKRERERGPPSVADPGSDAFVTPGSESGMNNPDHISESLETIFGLKYLNSLMRIRDPGWKKFGSGIKIPDLKHWAHLCNAIVAQLNRVPYQQCC